MGQEQTQTTKDAILRIQTRKGGLVQVSSGGREKRSDSRSTFKAEPTGFADELGLRKEKKRNQG